VDTEHFTFLYPDELSEWTYSIAERIESVFGAVDSLVGYAPEDKVTVIVDDPANVANGAMYAGPLLFLWPTPPSPRSLTGENRGWPEIVAVHEFAHAAHLTRLSRNPVRRFLTSLIPVPVTDMMHLAPRWLREGYATFIEGQVTGSGRPYGIWRPAVLRTWALEGQLPTYSTLNGSGGYFGGSMAYLVGSAFLEWLVDREAGDPEVLINLSRRLTARRSRNLNRAFAGVFGANPAELYGLFRTAVTENALAVLEAVSEAGGTVEGTLFQRLNWTTGDPSISPDGKHLAFALRSSNQPSRLVVISTTTDTLTDEQKRRQAQIYEDDPEDVRPVVRRPRPQRHLATLSAKVGRGYGKPAFLPDGDGILVVRSDLIENSRSRPDLFLWSWKSGDVRRITHGAAIREASPAPDGYWAVGTRCLHGRCDIVRIDLSSGEVTTLAQADIRRPYYHPRVSPDGNSIVASVQHEGRWRLVKMNVDGSSERLLGPEDGAARFDAEFLSNGDSVILTTTRGGIHNIETLDLRTGRVQPLTRMVSAAVAPTPSPEGEVFFLALHSRGWDLRRITLNSTLAEPVVVTDPEHTPAAAARSVSGISLQQSELGQATGYGLGPRYALPLPLFDGSIAGWSAGLALRSTDPIGKFTWQLQGMHGSADGWRGGGAEILWRGFQPWVRVQGFFLEGPLAGVSGAASTAERGAWDDDYYGGVVSLELRHTGLGTAHRFRAGGSVGRLDSIQNRVLAFAEYGLGLLQTRGSRRFSQTLGIHGSAGRTGDQNWVRWRLSGSASAQLTGLGFSVSGLIAGTDAPRFSDEELTVGGSEPRLFDPAIASFRLAMPALRLGTLRGDLVQTVRAEVDAGFPLTVFFWTGNEVGDGLDWYRLAGVEIDERLPEMSYLRLPAVRVRLGAARAFSQPDKGEWTAWATLSYRP
jgi:Tol biopolymer transport system component